jgi:hypothetical protein
LSRTRQGPETKHTHHQPPRHGHSSPVVVHDLPEHPDIVSAQQKSKGFFQKNRQRLSPEPMPGDMPGRQDQDEMARDT